jgi:bla regulator protein blaR1
MNGDILRRMNGLPTAEAQPETSAPTLIEMLRDDLGLKLEPTTGPVDILVVDHIEEPTAN